MESKVQNKSNLHLNSTKRPLIEVLSETQTDQSSPHHYATATKCVVCRKINPKYKCPKCKKPYCSIQHFKSHNLFCSQQFFQKQVKEQLKSTKVTDKKQKKKAIQLMKQFYTSLEEDNNIMADDYLSQEILQDWLKNLQQGKQIKLNSIQEGIFNQFIEKLMGGTDLQTIEFQCQKLFWEIEDGLSMYWLKDPQIEQYNQSEYPDVICYRHILHKRINELKSMNVEQQQLKNPENCSLGSKQQRKKKHIDKVIECHTLQLIYMSVILLRAYDGDFKEVTSVLTNIFGDMQNQLMLTTPPQLNLKTDYDEYAQSLLDFIGFFIKNHQQKDKMSQFSIIKQWIVQPQTRQVIGIDISTILKNKFLLIECLYRLFDSTKQNTKENKINLNVKKLTVKLEFLIKFYIKNSQGLCEMQKQMEQLWQNYFLSGSKCQSKEKPAILNIVKKTSNKGLKQ